MKRLCIALAFVFANCVVFAGNGIANNLESQFSAASHITEIRNGANWRIVYSMDLSTCTVTVTKEKVKASFTATDCKTALAAAAVFVKLARL